MGFFDFFKKTKREDEQKNVQLYNPVNGQVITIREVADPVFSQKMMGDGFGIHPADGKIYSPVKARVMSVFPAKHAIGLKLNNGVDLLLHVGIDTVELDGAPFEILVEEGEEVTPNTHLMNVNLDTLKVEGKADTVIVAFTNMEIVEYYSLANTGEMKQGELVGEIGSENK